VRCDRNEAPRSFSHHRKNSWIPRPAWFTIPPTADHEPPLATGSLHENHRFGTRLFSAGPRTSEPQGADSLRNFSGRPDSGLCHPLSLSHVASRRTRVFRDRRHLLGHHRHDHPRLRRHHLSERSRLRLRNVGDHLRGDLPAHHPPLRPDQPLSRPLDRTAPALPPDL